MMDYTKVPKTTHILISDYTCHVLNVNRSGDGRQEGIYFMTFGSFLLIIILICGVQYSRDRQCL